MQQHSQTGVQPSTHSEMTRFAILPKSAYASWFQSCFTCLPGIHVLALIYDQQEVVFLEFEFQHHTFRIQQFQDELWLTVRNPRCSPRVLRQVLRAFQQMPHMRKITPLDSIGAAASLSDAALGLRTP